MPVKSLPPNAWGLYEMHGNVWEWCEDGFAEFDAMPQTDPLGPTTSADRVLRGGCWIGGGRSVRSAYRGRGEPDYRDDGIGFRLALGQTGTGEKVTRLEPGQPLAEQVGDSVARMQGSEIRDGQGNSRGMKEAKESTDKGLLGRLKQWFKPK